MCCGPHWFLAANCAASLHTQCTIICISVFQTLCKYAVHLYDIKCDGTWESRSTFTFYVEFLFDTAQLLVTLAHYMHIWYLNGYVACACCRAPGSTTHHRGCDFCPCLGRFSFRIVDAVLFLNVRSVFTSLRGKIAAYKNFLSVSRVLDARWGMLMSLHRVKHACAS